MSLEVNLQQRVSDMLQKIADLQIEKDQLIRENAEHEAGFTLRWNSDMRAIKRWQEKTGRIHVWPDHTDLSVWLMEQWEKSEDNFKKHTEEVGKFLSEMHATMIDPLAEGEIKVAEMCKIMLEAARSQREELNRLMERNEFLESKMERALIAVAHFTHRYNEDLEKIKKLEQENTALKEQVSNV